MASGANNSGDDMVVGRTNRSEIRTILVAQNGDNAPDGYADDFVLDVSTVGDQVLPTNSRGVDAIHAKGTIAFPTGGEIGTIPAANGVVGQGLNGIVGYVHPATRDKGTEQDSHAGVLGMGAPNDAGVLAVDLTGSSVTNKGLRATAHLKRKKRQASSVLDLSASLARLRAASACTGLERQVCLVKARATIRACLARVAQEFSGNRYRMVQESRGRAQKAGAVSSSQRSGRRFGLCLSPSAILPSYLGDRTRANCLS